MNSSEARWRGKWTTETRSRSEGREREGLEWWQRTRAPLHGHVPGRDLAYSLWSPASALLDQEEQSAVRTCTSTDMGVARCCVPRGKRVSCVSRGFPDPAALWLSPLCQSGFQVFPVRVRSSQKHLHSNKSHLGKHKFPCFTDFGFSRSLWQT